MTTARDWKEARAKVDREGCCRVCRSTVDVQAAHVIGRRYDELVIGARGGKRMRVRAVDVVPLCPRCHGRYDRRDLDLLPYLTWEEQAAAVATSGIAGAVRRICGGDLVVA